MDTKAWNGETPGGPLRYAGIACSSPAPVNDIATDLTTYNTRLPGSRSPASTRMHPLEFNATRQGPPGTFRLEGKTTLTVCDIKGGPTTDGKPDATRDTITFDWTAVADKTSRRRCAGAGASRSRVAPASTRI